MTGNAERAVWLRDRVTKVRDLINEPRKQYQLLQDGARWAQLCSSLDAIGDAEHAIDAHRKLRRAEQNVDIGTLYLAHYGLMQALYLQQNAVQQLGKCLNVALGQTSLDRQDVLKKVRDVRNDVAHLTDRRRGNTLKPLGISQASMEASGFDLYTFSEFGLGMVKISLDEYADAQHGAISGILDEIIETLETEDRMHKEQFKSKPLAPIFRAVEYSLGKVCEATGVLARNEPWANAENQIAEGSLRSIEAQLEELFAALRKREQYPDVYTHLDDTERDVRRVIARLHRIFQEGVAAVVDPIDADGLALLLEKLMRKLREFAEGLDEYYGS